MLSRYPESSSNLKKKELTNCSHSKIVLNTMLQKKDFYKCSKEGKGYARLHKPSYLNRSLRS